jgi:hypothetical protein
MPTLLGYRISNQFGGHSFRCTPKTTDEQQKFFKKMFFCGRLNYILTILKGILAKKQFKFQIKYT